MLLASGCSEEYDDSALTGRVDNLENRVHILEELCKQMNTNVSSLQTLVTALQDNDYVKSVTSVMQDGQEIGYTITFTKSKPITIYHGQDGKKGDTGAAGNDGHTPVIGVRQDTDGIYYWTLDGDWLTEDGNKIKAQGTDGQNGASAYELAVGKGYTGTLDEWLESLQGNSAYELAVQKGYEGTLDEWLEALKGASGQDGEPGIIPKLKIVNGYWQVSYDGEKSWEQLGKATGNDGQDGDPMFQGVDYKTSNNYVIFTLSDGTQIKLPTWSAFEALQTLCNQMNTNISSLQTIVTALQNNDYVKGVSPIMQSGKEIGYTITFTKSDPITIYHGKDGQDGNDGAPGQDGTTPVIGVMRHTDGVYYWTLDGEWLTDTAGNKIKAEGTDGKDGTDGKPGEDGQQGQDGQPGKDGITPQLRIEAGYWEISYDNGDSWTQLGKATGEDGAPGQDGKPGENGKDGDSIFSKIEDKASEVVFTLADGVTAITIPKYAVPTPLDITFDTTESINVLPGKSYEIGYTLEGANEQTIIDAIAQNGYRARVVKTDYRSGKIVITAPETVVDDRIIVLVNDGNDRALMRFIHIAESVIRITTDSYTVEADGGTQTVEVETNVDYTVHIAEADRAWVGVASATRTAVHTETLNFTFLPNPNTTFRYATVELRDASGMVSQSILFAQKASGYKTVHVVTAGTLDNYIPETERENLIGLKITGTLNTSDYDFIRTLPALENLDIAQITNTTIPAKCFKESSIKQIILPLNLIAIPDNAFHGSKITAIKIPSSVISIGLQAFYQCSELTGNLILPNGLQSIGQKAFYECKNLTGNLMIPNSVTILDSYAFYGCSGFTGSLVLGTGITIISKGCFQNCSGFTGNLVIPDQITEIEERGFQTSGFDGYLLIGSGMKTIQAYGLVVPKIAKTYCKAPTPPTIGTYSFSSKNYLGVPTGCRAAYLDKSFWDKFSIIEEVEF